MESKKFVYLYDLKFVKKNISDTKPDYIEYNCKTCKKKMLTGPYGSYIYCLSCFNKWEKREIDKTKRKVNNNCVEFID